MSLEAKVQSLTDAITALTVALQNQSVVVQDTPVVPEIANVQANALAAIAPTPPPVEQPKQPEAPVAPPINAMPPPPAMEAPAPATPSTDVPFSDGSGLVAYVMAAYQALGPTKGAEIGKVLSSLNYSNINDVKPEHYGQFYAGIEALK